MARRNVQAAPRPPANSQSSTSDVEGDDSQRVLALSSLLQTPKTNHKELQDFKARVAHDQKQLKALLEQRMWQAEAASTRRRNELTKAILDALQTPNRPVHRTPRTLGDTKIARNAVFKSVADVLTASEHLVGEYDQLDQLIVGIGDAEQEGVADAWAADIEKTDRLLKVGAESAIRNVKKVLGADIEADDVEDVREEAIEKMEAIENMKLNYELHTSLLCAERGVRKIVKSLSLEEGQ